MERKHYVRINPGLQLVEKAGLLAKTREQEQDHAYLCPEQVPNSREEHHLCPTCTSSNSQQHQQSFRFCLN